MSIRRSAHPRTAVAVTLAAGLAGALAGAAPARAAALPPPATLAYQQRAYADSVIYVNNPEAINAGRDTDDHAMHRQAINPGYHRDFWEQSTTGQDITYGVLLQNTSACTLAVTTAGKASVVGQRGGVPWAAMLNALQSNPGTTAQTVPAGSAVWLHTMAVTKGRFFSGVMDFLTETTGDCPGGAGYVKHFAFTGALPSPATAAAMQYRGPVDFGSDARTYNGAFVVPGAPTTPVTDVVAENLDYTIDDDTPVGVWNPTTGVVSNQFPVTYNGATHTGWNTHVTAARDPGDGVGTDMVSIMMPLDDQRPDTLTEIHPDRTDPRKPELGTPNLGNWGVVYTVGGTITNSGTRQHVVTTGVARTVKGQYLQLATRCWSTGQSGPWEVWEIGPDDTNPVSCQVTVPAGQSRTYAMQLVVGGPSGTHLHQFQTKTS